MTQVKANGSEEQRKGNGERDNDGAANVSQEQKQNDGNKDHSFGQVVFYGLHGEADQLGSIKERLNGDAGRKDAGVIFVAVEFFHFLVNALQHRVGVIAFLQ